MIGVNIANLATASPVAKLRAHRRSDLSPKGYFSRMRVPGHFKVLHDPTGICAEFQGLSQDMGANPLIQWDL